MQKMKTTKQFFLSINAILFWSFTIQTKAVSNKSARTADAGCTVAKIAEFKYAFEDDKNPLFPKKLKQPDPRLQCDQKYFINTQKKLLRLFKRYYQLTKKNSDDKWNYTTDTLKLWFDKKDGNPILQVKDKKSIGKWKEWDEEMNATSYYENLWVDREQNAVKGYFFENNDFYEMIGKPPTKTLRTFWFNNKDKIFEILIYWIPEENRLTSEYLKPVLEWAEKNYPEEIKTLYPNGEIIPSRENAIRWKRLLEKYSDHSAEKK